MEWCCESLKFYIFVNDMWKRMYETKSKLTFSVKKYACSLQGQAKTKISDLSKQNEST